MFSDGIRFPLSSITVEHSGYTNITDADGRPIARLSNLLTMEQINAISVAIANGLRKFSKKE